MAGKVVRDKKLEEYENENYYFLWCSDKRHFPYNCLGLTDEDNSVSRTDNFVNVNVFNSVTSPRVLSYRWVLHYFSTMPVGRIKIVTVDKRSIFQVEWLITTLILVFICFICCLLNYALGILKILEYVFSIRETRLCATQCKTDGID